ncbi:MAG: PQQ-dependent sugar dehydrogenase [Pseudohongiellaceae bacterium]
MNGTSITTHLLLTALLVCLTGIPAHADGEWQIETVASGLEHPWSLAFLPDGRILVTERAGRLRIIEEGELLPEPVANVPAAYVAMQAGLFEVLPAPDFADSRQLYLSLASGTARSNTIRVVRARLAGQSLTDVETVFESQPMRATPVHYGGRMVFLPDGTLLLGTGDGFDYREMAQQRDNHIGSIYPCDAISGKGAEVHMALEGHGDYCRAHRRTLMAEDCPQLRPDGRRPATRPTRSTPGCPGSPRTQKPGARRYRR